MYVKQKESYGKLLLLFSTRALIHLRKSNAPININGQPEESTSTVFGFMEPVSIFNTPDSQQIGKFFVFLVCRLDVCTVFDDEL